MQRSHAAAWRGRRRGRGPPGVRKTKTNGGSEAYGYEVRGVCGRVLPARCLRGPPLCAAHREMTKTSLKPAEFGETRNRRIPLGLGPALDHRTEVSCPHLRPRPRDHRCLATPVPFRHLFTPKSLRPRALWRHQLHSSDSANARFVFELRNASYIRRHSSALRNRLTGGGTQCLSRPLVIADGVLVYRILRAKLLASRRLDPGIDGCRVRFLVRSTL